MFRIIFIFYSHLHAHDTQACNIDKCYNSLKKCMQPIIFKSDKILFDNLPADIKQQLQNILPKSSASLALDLSSNNITIHSQKDPHNNLKIQKEVYEEKCAKDFSFCKEECEKQETPHEVKK